MSTNASTRAPLRVVYETHATTVDNELGLATGWQQGELSPAGRRQAEELGRRRSDDGIDLVMCSDLARAAQTVDIALAGQSVLRRKDRRLREVDYGDLTGSPVDRIEAERVQRVDTPFPRGQSYRQVTDGVRDLLVELGRSHSGGRVLLVGHAATRYALDHLLTGRPLEAAVAGPFHWRAGWEYVVDDGPPTVEVLDGDGALAVADELTGIYRSAFTAPGYDETEATIERFADHQLPSHAGRDGFRCVLLRHGPDAVGFAYGYTGERGQWWSDQVAASASTELVERWLGGHFELVEIAVDPAVQGRGLGTALHDTLLMGRPHDRALLTTFSDDRAAPRLYRRLGWELLQPGVLPGSDLYGLDLAARRA